nr:DUF6591 domain-containing protein [uncultured Blautia sp.]
MRLAAFRKRLQFDKIKGERYDWEELQLCDRLPKPKSKTGRIISNSGDGFELELDKVKGSDYKAYIEKCQDMGYTIDSESTGDDFTAFDENGYGVIVHFYENEMNIELDAPVEMGELIWPKSEIAGLLPMPASTVGKVTSDDADGCFIYIGQTPIEDFNAYADQCADKGFSVDYQRGDRFYRADDAYGNHLSLIYKGNNVMTIDLSKPYESQMNDTDTETQVTEAPEQPVSDDATETETENTEVQDDTELIDGMHPDFKQAMDSYEEFMNKYCDFMDKYDKSNGTDPTLLIDYADYAAKYAQAMKDFEAWESEGLNTAEAAYYLEVQTRVNEKLAKFLQ